MGSGIAKRVQYKVEGTYGTIPAATAPVGQILRRVTSDLNLTKETYQSNESRSDRQVSDFRHGVRSVAGTINGELSPATYRDFIAAALMQAWQTAATTGALTDVTAAVAAPQFVTAGGNFITSGFKVGDVVRWAGFAGGSATNNNNRNFLITALTTTNMTGVFLDGTAVVADVAGDSVTCTAVGKKTWVPLTGHTDLSYSIEHYYADDVLSEVYSGCKVNQIDIQLPATGMATIGVGFMGKDITTAGAEYFASSTAETVTGIVAAVNGALYLNGTAVANITGMNFTISRNMTSVPVIGSNTKAVLSPGRCLVSGQITAKFDSATMRDLFINETEAAINAVFTTANTATADFIGITMSRVKVGGASKDDGEKEIIQTLPFTALLDTAGGTATTEDTLKTTISIQDSAA